MKLRIIILIAALVISLTVCSTKSAKTISNHDKFKIQACSVVYCENSELSKIKKAGLKIMELSAGVAGFSISLDRGYCEEYYKKREFMTGYVYAKKSSYQLCIDN